MINQKKSIKHNLLLSVSVLISIIVLGMTAIAYYQYHTSQIKKTVSQAEAIISPFYEIIRQELPDQLDDIDLYLSVALQAKEGSQLPVLLTTHRELQGICFFNLAGNKLLCHGQVINGQRQADTLHFSGEQIQVMVPFEMNGRKLGSSLLAFSSSQFEQEKQQILFVGSLFLLFFLVLGLVGAHWVGRSIAGPIEKLARHIELNKLEDIPLQERLDEIGDFSRTINAMSITLKKREQELEHMAYYDRLTKLPNRSLYMDRLYLLLNQAQRDSSRIAILFIDLNGFKYVNDTYGHDAGDNVLKQVADRLNSAIRKADTLARLSGDEFNLILQNPGTMDDISNYSSRLLKLFDTPFKLPQRKIFISVSIGISRFPNDSDNAEGLINNADRAMYYAKGFGGNQFRFYNSELHEHNRERLALESDLRNAINDESIYLHYQPKIYLHNGKLSGIEALARWDHPVLGNIPPDRFIGIAEEVGLITELDNLVMRKACLQMKAWLDKGLDDMPISINLSPHQFSNPELVETISQTLEETGLEAKNLELEITESAAMYHPDQAIETLYSIRKKGISIALDDFGKGHSSLNRLHQFPLSRLKIDKSFIFEMEKNKDAFTFVKSVISMTNALSLKTVIEGVETKAQAELLKGLEVPVLEAQGYYFSRPLAADQFEKLVSLSCSNEMVQ